MTPVDVLNRLLEIEYRSLPRYLSVTSPWTHRGDEKASAALADIVKSQEMMAGKLVDLVQQLGGVADFGSPRIEFTDLNLLSLDYLVSVLIEHQKDDIHAVEACIADLSTHLPARALAEEVLGSERAHLEALEDLASQPSK